MGRNQSGIRTRQRIIDATRALLAESGLDGTTLAAICDRAEIRAGSFYNLFDSKEDAVLLVVREAIDAVDPDPAHVGTDTVADLIGAYIKFVTGEPAIARIYLQVAVNGGMSDKPIHDRVIAHHQRRLERFRDAALRADPTADPERVTLDTEILLATLHGLAFRSLLDDEFDFSGTASELIT
ncbi:MAG: TetR/AcrR family transcriptional regulator [Acidimicrobiia bacterium]|nr:TetR/AcrR family transcriptional regulator [Acidimicrobiia bacterium]